MKKISGIYKITNTVTGEFYIGSSKNIMHRWASHKSQSTWKKWSEVKLYQVFQQYGLESFTFEIIEETDDLKNREQYFINLSSPSYNDRRAFGHDLDKYRSSKRKYNKSYRKSEKYRKYDKAYKSQLCLYNEEQLTLNALTKRFRKANIPNPMTEARKYLIVGI